MIQNSLDYLQTVQSWKLHIEQVLHMLSAACYALRSIKHYVSGNNENGLLCLLSLCYVIWNKRGQLELSQEARIEILAEIYLKN
jgi:hypothetical protein